MSEEPQKVEVEVPSSDQTPSVIVDDEKRQKKLAGLAKAREAKKQKALQKKQQEMEDALKNKGEHKSKKGKEKESDSEEEVDIETILTALDNTASSKKIDQIHQLLTDLRDMKLKSKEKKKKKKVNTANSSKPATTSSPPPHNKIREKAKSNINTLAGGFGKLTD